MEEDEGWTWYNDFGFMGGIGLILVQSRLGVEFELSVEVH